MEPMLVLLFLGLALLITIFFGSKKERQNLPERVIAESRKAKLIQKEDGSIVCTCPYLCMATYEKCEFTDHPLVIKQNSK